MTNPTPNPDSTFGEQITHLIGAVERLTELMFDGYSKLGPLGPDDDVKAKLVAYRTWFETSAELSAQGAALMTEGLHLIEKAFAE